MTAHDDAHDAGPPATPWASAAGDGGVACVILWTTGTDVRVDRIVRIAAVRPNPSGDDFGDEGTAWESIERTCSDAADDGEGALARVRVDFGVAPEELARAPRAADAWGEVRDFLGDHPVVTLDGALLDAWARSLDAATGVAAPPLRVVGLEDFAGLLEPGHLCSLSPPRLIGALLEPALAPEPPAAVHPPHALAALAELVARFADLGPAVHALGRLAWTRALEGLRGEDLAAASRLAIALDLVDRPSLWAGDGALFAAGRLRDGVLSTADAETLDEDDPLSLLEPAVAELVRDSLDGKPLEADTEDPAPFVDEDLALLDDLFRVHLPGQFASTAAERNSGELYRKSQHRVAEEVARSLGSDELLLVHAPTGTGKTLAYLLPALLWSRRYDVRVGVATYTRALQSQAMEREVPRALSALASAGVPPGFRVSVLKGREHSLCWRALRIHSPRPSDDPETWLAWTALALFGLRDGEGDLDRFPRRSPVRLMGAGAYRSALRALLDLVRGRSGCCTAQADRGVCAAEVARRRAERSHVVLTNQSFALARPEFFRRVVFDECEHLHDQAMSAWSHRVSFPEIRRVLTRLHEPGPKGAKTTRNRPPLDRLAGKLPTGSAAREQLDAARALWSRAASELSRLEAEVLEYERWRSNAVLGRGESELHGLFREYVEASDAASGLVDARTALQSALARLDGSLAQLAEELEMSGIRRVDRVRRTLERSRVDLAGVGEAVAAWLPLDDGAPRLGGGVFHDVERNVRGDAVLAALVLLPGDALGRHYYPELASAAFVSATTRLGGSFDKAKGYLGLDRVAARDPLSDEFDRTGGTRRVTSFHAPEVFDYGRVLVGAPRGVPSVQSRDAYLDFLARYLPWYAERSRGRMLCLFTSLRDVREVGERAEDEFHRRGLPLLWQGMDAAGKEELSDLFRERVESTLLGVDTFWYGADFPGETLETLVIARLPYGVPDRYHHAQCAALGRNDQHRRIYMPRALAKFRQGFGRLMRKETDRGVVLVLDGRITERRHREFLEELPVERPGAFGDAGRARLVRGDIDLLSREAFEHLGAAAEIQRRGLDASFTGRAVRAPAARRQEMRPAVRDLPPIEVDLDDLPY